MALIGFEGRIRLEVNKVHNMFVLSEYGIFLLNSLDIIVLLLYNCVSLDIIAGNLDCKSAKGKL